MEKGLRFGMFEHSDIFQDEIVLDKGYNPTKISEILHRKKEIESYMRHLAKALKNIVPGNLFIYGKMGIGKTMVTKVLTSELEKEALSYGIRVKTVYLHCKAVPTNVGVFKCINNSLGLETNHGKIKTANSFDAYFFRFCKLASEYKGVVIIILDEIDKLKDPDILNLLSRVKESGFLENNVCVIGITNDIHFDEKLDARTKSILSETVIIFPPYDANQLRDILSQRAEQALKPGVLEETVIPLCAAYAAQEHGDARKALELLRISGNIAEERNDKKITEKHVKAALERIENDKVNELIQTLPTQSKIVLASCIINESASVKSYTGEIYNRYKECSRQLGVEILSQHRIAKLLSELSAVGLVNALTISKGRYGRTKEVSLAVKAKSAWEVLMEDYRLSSLGNFNVIIGDIEGSKGSKEAEILQMSLRSFK
jgi:cell division control protein 6